MTVDEAAELLGGKAADKEAAIALAKLGDVLACWPPLLLLGREVLRRRRPSPEPGSVVAAPASVADGLAREIEQRVGQRRTGIGDEEEYRRKTEAVLQAILVPDATARQAVALSRAISRPQTSLPAFVEPLVGRQKDLLEVMKVLRKARLVTLRGRAA